MNPAKTKPTTKALIDVRNLPLERFRMAKDGRKWKQIARSRFAVLEFIASFANGDGTVGKYSPGIQRQIKRHGLCHTWLYRLHDDLNELGFLSWERERKGHHNQKREYVVTIPETPETTPEAPVANEGARKLFEDEHVNYSDSEQANYSQEHVNYSDEHVKSRVAEHVNSRVATTVFPSKEPKEIYMSNSDKNGPSPSAQGGQSEAVLLTSKVLSRARQTTRGRKCVIRSKHQETIRSKIAQSDWTEQELLAATANIIEPLNDFELSTAGDLLSVSLGPEIDAIRKGAEEQRKQDALKKRMEQFAAAEQKRMAAEAEAELAEIARKKAEDEKALQELVA